MQVPASTHRPANAHNSAVCWSFKTYSPNIITSIKTKILQLYSLCNMNTHLNKRLISYIRHKHTSHNQKVWSYQMPRDSDTHVMDASCKKECCSKDICSRQECCLVQSYVMFRSWQLQKRMPHMVNITNVILLQDEKQLQTNTDLCI